MVCMAMCLFTWSMKTSNSSKHRIGHPRASQSDMSKQIVENDFSPPDSALGSVLPRLNTCTNLKMKIFQQTFILGIWVRLIGDNTQVKRMSIVVEFNTSSIATLPKVV